MIIDVTCTQARVVDANDCTRLHVTADGLADDEVGAVLQRAGLGGAGDAGHVWLAIAALRAAARASAWISDWDHHFDAMVAFARSKGWLDVSGENLAAHIERGAR